MSAAARKICVVTGARADYGCLRWVMQGISRFPRARTAGHRDRHASISRIRPHLSRDRAGRICHRCQDRDAAERGHAGRRWRNRWGWGSSVLARRCSAFGPICLFVLGDRFEIFAAAAAATVAAHSDCACPRRGDHGRRVRRGAAPFDHQDVPFAFRGRREYRKRVIQLGEHPERVLVVGGLGLDNLAKLTLLDREALEAALGFKLGRKEPADHVSPRYAGERDLRSPDDASCSVRSMRSKTPI